MTLTAVKVGAAGKVTSRVLGLSALFLTATHEAHPAAETRTDGSSPWSWEPTDGSVAGLGLRNAVKHSTAQCGGGCWTAPFVESFPICLYYIILYCTIQYIKVCMVYQVLCTVITAFVSLADGTLASLDSLSPYLETSR